MKYVVYARYSNLYGEKLSLQEAYTRLSQYGLLDAIFVLSRIDLTLGYHYEDIIKAQVKLLTAKLGCSHIVDRIKHYLNCNPDIIQMGDFIVFHELQILNAMKLAFVHCTHKTKELSESPWQALVEALLIINDYLYPPELTDIEEIDEVDDVKDEIMRYIIMNVLFHTSEPDIYRISKWRELLFETCNRIDRKHHSFIDFHKIFKERYGITIDEFFSCCFGLYAYWATLKQKEIDIGQVRLSSKKTLAKFNIDPKTYDRILGEISAPIEWFQKEFKNSDNLDPFYFLPFQQKPLMKYGDDLICLSKKFFIDKMTSGLYHMLLNSFEKEKERDQCLRFFGVLYEQCLSDIMNEKFNEGSVRRFYQAVKYAKGQNETCDGIVDYGNKLLLTEFKATLLSLEFLVHGTKDEFLRKITDIVFDGVTQIARTIDDFIKKNVSIGNIDSAQICRFYPVIVTLQHIPIEPLLSRFIAKELERRDVLCKSNIEPIEIFDTYSLEAILTITDKGMTCLDIIEQKHSEIKWAENSISDFLNEKYPNDKKISARTLNRFAKIKNELKGFWKET